MKLVISRFNESIEWSKEFNSIIYNKGQPLPNTLSLPNVGREGHTYLHHIITNYDTLDEYTVFLQGYPFDHSPNLLRDLRSIQKALDSSTFRKFDYLTLCRIIITDDSNGKPSNKQKIPLGKHYTELFEDSQTSFTYGCGAQFIVSRNAIHKRPKAFYEVLIKNLESEIDPMYGYIYERLWSSIFSNTPLRSIH
jgi:hypothetical protein